MEPATSPLQQAPLVQAEAAVAAAVAVAAEAAVVAVAVAAAVGAVAVQAAECPGLASWRVRPKCWLPSMSTVTSSAHKTLRRRGTP